MEDLMISAEAKLRTAWKIDNSPGIKVKDLYYVVMYKIPGESWLEMAWEPEILQLKFNSVLKTVHHHDWGKGLTRFMSMREIFIWHLETEIVVTYNKARSALADWMQWSALALRLWQQFREALGLPIMGSLYLLSVRICPSQMVQMTSILPRRVTRKIIWC